jgi:hypothetical protein
MFSRVPPSASRNLTRVQQVFNYTAEQTRYSSDSQEQVGILYSVGWKRGAVIVHVLAVAVTVTSTLVSDRFCLSLGQTSAVMAHSRKAVSETWRRCGSGSFPPFWMRRNVQSQLANFLRCPGCDYPSFAPTHILIFGGGDEI